MTNGWSILQQGTDLLKGKTARKKTMEEDHALLTLKGKKKGIGQDLGRRPSFFADER